MAEKTTATITSTSLMEKLSGCSSKVGKDADEEGADTKSPSRRSTSTSRGAEEKNWFQRNKKLSALIALLLLLMIIISASLAGTKTKDKGTTPVIIQPFLTTNRPTGSPTPSPITTSPTSAPNVHPTISPTSSPTGSPSTGVPSTPAPTKLELIAGPTKSLKTPEPTKSPEVTTVTTTTSSPTGAPVTLRPSLRYTPPCSEDEPCNEPQLCVSGRCSSSRLPDLTGCDRSTDCQSNRCGLEEYSDAAKKVCCPAGRAIVFPVAWTLTHQWVCRELQPGQPCADDRSCASGACVVGLCMETRVEDMETCDSAADCQNRRCGRQEFDSTAPFICCSEGDFLLLDVPWNFAHEDFCSHQKPGEKCLDDRSCESGVCVQGQCADHFLDDGDECDKDSSCATGYCGRKEFEEQAPTVCCEGGDAMLVDTQHKIWDNALEWLCGNMELGSKCFDDSSCLSGVCSLGTCVDATVAENMLCDSDHDCTNGRCGRAFLDAEAPYICCPGSKAQVQGVVWSATFEWICSPNGSAQQVGDAGDGESCNRDLDCGRRVCGKSEFSSNAQDVCCPQGKKYKLPVPWAWSLHNFCGGLELGAICGDDRNCESGQCVQGVCSAELNAEMESCGKHSDCASRACAGGEFAQNAAQVCCPEGERYKDEVPWTYGEEWFCGNLPVDTKCGKDGYCKSNLCIGGTCATEPLDIYEECAESWDCKNLACAKTVYVENPDDVKKECCPGGDILLLHFPGGFDPDWYCDDVKRPIRAHCVEDSECESGSCSIDNSCL